MKQPSAPPPRSDSAPREKVSDASLNRIAGWGGLCAWTAVVVPLLSDSTARAQTNGFWWTAVTVFLIVYLLFAFGPTDRPAFDRASAVLLVTLFTVAVFALPGYGLNGIISVVAIVAVAIAAPVAITLAVVLGQSIVLCSAGLYAGNPLGQALVLTVSYAGLQLFAFVMVESGNREARARQALVAAQAQLDEASRAAERLRIARDLHDQIGHQLTALALNLEAATHLAAGTPAAAPVEACRVLAKETLADVRDVVGRLRTPESREHDGAALAHRLGELAAAVPSPHITVSVTEITTLGHARYDALVRAGQEAITNAVRHSRAERLQIDVRGEDGEIVLRAVDDGIGTDQDAEMVEGNGLRGMRERFAHLGGVVTVTTAPGAGFRLVARLPDEAA